MSSFELGTQISMMIFPWEWCGMCPGTIMEENKMFPEDGNCEGERWNLKIEKSAWKIQFHEKKVLK